jgi:hypothetical protein
LYTGSLNVVALELFLTPYLKSPQNKQDCMLLVQGSENAGHPTGCETTLITLQKNQPPLGSAFVGISHPMVEGVPAPPQP